MKLVINGKTADLPAGGAGQEVYSTEETRIGTWINGKPLYRKCFNTRTAPSSDTYTLANIAENEEVVFIKVTCKDENGSIVNFPFWFSNTYYATVWVYQTYINMQTKEPAIQDVPCVVVIEYTKTTDTAAKEV